MTTQLASRQQRRQRFNRLTVLVAVLLLVAGGIYSLFLFNSGRNALSDEEIIAAARQAFEDLDYARVIELLEQEDNPGSTLDAIQDNAELLDIYVTTRIEFPLDRNMHLQRLIGPLKQICELEPENLTDRQKLLDLLFTLNRDSQALELAEQYAEAFPDNADMLRYLGTAQLRTNKRRMALQTLTEATKLNPLDVQIQSTVLDLIQESGDDVAPFIKRAEQLYQQHEQDPRAAMIRSLAYRAEDNGVQARALLEQAASQQPADSDMIALLTRWLDREGLYPTAADYLIQHAEQGIETRAGELAIYRAFETNNHKTILARLADTDPRWANPDVLGMWALAHLKAGDQDAAQVLIKQLRRRDTAVADAWSKVLQLEIDRNPSPGAVIDTIVNVFEVNSDRAGVANLLTHPYMLQRLGDAYRSAEEPEAAISALRLAAANSDSWASPHFALADALLELGQANDALVFAQQAAERDPQYETSALLVRAMAAATDPAEAQAVDQVLYQADKLLAEDPGAQGVLFAVVDLLASAGQDAQAKQRIEVALSSAASLSSKQLLDLAGLSQVHELSLESTIAESMRKRHGVTPELITLQAKLLAVAGNAEGGQHLFEQSMPTPVTMPWEIAFAKYRTAHQSETALPYLAELAEKYPANIELQVALLRHWDSKDGRDIAEQTIERLKASAGESSINWRLAQARLNMAGQPSEQELRHVVTLLTRIEDLTPIHLKAQLMLTRCLLQLGDDRAAAESASNTKMIASRHPEAMLLYGKAMHRLSRYQDSRIDLIALANNPRVDPEFRLQACTLLSEQGERGIVRGALESMRRDGLANNRALLILAKHYIALGDSKNAEQICSDLLKQPDAESIGFVASYYRRTDRPDLAEQALASALPAGISAADRLMLGAEDAARRGEAQVALADIEKAAEEDPDNAQRWHAAVQMALALAQPDQAHRLAVRGLKAIPTDEGLKAYTQHQHLLRQAAGNDVLIPMAATVLNSKENRTHAIHALRIILEGGKPTAIAEQLADTASRAPDFKQLNELAADYLFDAGLIERANELASITMARFPNSAAAARVSTLAAYELQSWAELLNSAKTWADRNPQDRHHADLMRAAAEIHLERHAIAVKTLKPYLAHHTNGPTDSEAYFELYTHALVMSGKTAEAWATLAPQLRSSPAARQIAIKRVSDNLQDPDTSASWLDAIEDCPLDNSERFTLATASYMAGLRLNSEPLVKAAAQRINRLLAEPGPHGIDIYYVHGQIAQHLGDTVTAEVSFRKVLASAPDNPLVLNNLALALADQGGDKLSEAEQLAERATRLSSKDPNLFDTLAAVRLKRDHLKEALEAIEIAIRLDPNNPAWHLTMADILEAAGEADRADLIRQRFEQRVRF